MKYLDSPITWKDSLYKRIGDKKYKKAIRYAEKYKIKLELNRIKNKYKSNAKCPTSKFLVGFLMLNFSIVEIYSMWAMFILGDLTSLSTLITCVIGEVLSYAIYSAKSIKENTSGGIIYESAIEKMKHDTLYSNFDDGETTSG